MDKARLPVKGLPLAEHVAAVLASGGCSPVALIRRGPPDGLPWRRPVVREDEALPRHVLSGFISALDWARGPVLVAATDLYALTPSLVATLATSPGAVVCGDGRAAVLAHLLPADREGLLDAVSSGRSLGAWAQEREKVHVHELPNANRWEDMGQAHPIRALLDRLGLHGSAAARAERGERARLAARGCLLP